MSRHRNNNIEPIFENFNASHSDTASHNVHLLLLEESTQVSDPQIPDAPLLQKALDVALKFRRTKHGSPQAFSCSFEILQGFGGRSKADGRAESLSCLGPQISVLGKQHDGKHLVES